MRCDYVRIVNEFLGDESQRSRIIFGHQVLERVLSTFPNNHLRRVELSPGGPELQLTDNTTYSSTDNSFAIFDQFLKQSNHVVGFQFAQQHHENNENDVMPPCTHQEGTV